jgi:hypothetical protein
MTGPQFLITPYLLENFESNSLKLKLKTKINTEHNLTLVYTDYNSSKTGTPLQNECRSLVLNENKKIIAYSGETPLMNKEGMNYLLQHTTDKQLITESYEGTILSMFFHNDKWFVSTRRCLDCHDSKINGQSHYDMFNETLKENKSFSSNLTLEGAHSVPSNETLEENIEEFTNKLDKSKSYYFVLLHHNNKLVIDYTSTHGENYKKLYLTEVRDENMNELPLEENFIEHTNVLLPKKYESLDEFTEYNKTVTFEKPVKEGVIVKVWSEELNKYRMVKLQYNVYQFYQSSSFGQSTTNINQIQGLIHLYQIDKLQEFFTQNPESSHKKIINPTNSDEEFDIVGIIDAVFKTLSIELFELFKILCDIKTGKQVQEKTEFYNGLSKEYKDIIYAIRGLYFKKKALKFTEDKTNSLLKYNDIYTLIKDSSTETIIAFLRQRKLTMSKLLPEFVTINSNCEKINTKYKMHNKLTAILTNILFP